MSEDVTAKMLADGLTEMVGILVAGLRDGRNDEVIGLVQSVDETTLAGMLLIACSLLETAMKYGTFPDSAELDLLGEAEQVLKEAVRRWGR